MWGVCVCVCVRVMGEGACRDEEDAESCSQELCQERLGDLRSAPCSLLSKAPPNLPPHLPLLYCPKRRPPWIAWGSHTPSRGVFARSTLLSVSYLSARPPVRGQSSVTSGPVFPTLSLYNDFEMVPPGRQRGCCERGRLCEHREGEAGCLSSSVMRVMCVLKWLNEHQRLS